MRPLAPPPQSEIGGPQWKRWLYDLWGIAREERGEFRPTLTVNVAAGGSIGDLDVTYYAQNRIRWVRSGSYLHFAGRMLFQPEFTTASGEVVFSGFPFEYAREGGESRPLFSVEITEVMGGIRPAYPAGASNVLARFSGLSPGTLVNDAALPGPYLIISFQGDQFSQNMSIDDLSSGERHSIYVAGAYEAMR